MSIEPIELSFEYAISPCYVTVTDNSITDLVTIQTQSISSLIIFVKNYLFLFLFLFDQKSSKCVKYNKISKVMCSSLSSCYQR